ncbi:hypothetical protein BJ912DRAFT_409411 [Pholiota molesta]|nr:hypothetical protein BJ912DRAFT_409411 [Pholiota molesta]
MSTSQCSSSSSGTRLPVPPRTPTKKKSLRDLNAAAPLGGRPKASGSCARAATISLQPSPRNSPGRGGLTLRIEDNMAEYDKTKGIQSAPPVRATRRLPDVPPPPVPTVIIDAGDAPSTPLLAPVLHTNAPPARAKRALPCPPTPVIEFHTPTQSVAALATPVERRRRPLPIPIPPTQKVDALYNIPSPALATSRSLPISSSLSTPLTPKIPSPSLIATFPRPETIAPPKTTRHHHSASENRIPGRMLTARRALPPRKLHASRSSIDLTLDVVQLHRKFVVERSPVCISLECDSPSSPSEEEEYTEEVRSTAVFFRDAVPVVRQKELKSGGEVDGSEELHVDYAWLLSNRILHHQKPPGVTSKWMREKKGKRYTEEDFDNILNALRSL